MEMAGSFRASACLRAPRDSQGVLVLFSMLGKYPRLQCRQVAGDAGFRDGRTGRAQARPAGSREEEGEHCERADARRQIDLHIHRYSIPGFHLGDPPGCDAPLARKGCGVSAPRCDLTGARGSIGPAYPGRPGSTGIALAWTPAPFDFVENDGSHGTGKVPDVRRLGGGMDGANRISPGPAGRSFIIRGAESSPA